MTRSRMLDDAVLRVLFNRAGHLAMEAGWVHGWINVGLAEVRAWDVEADGEEGEEERRRVTLAVLRAEAERTDPLEGDGYEWLARALNASPPVPLENA